MGKLIFLPEVKKKLYNNTARNIYFYRNNPCIACEDLLGIKLLDVQKYVLQASWNASYIAWAACRDWGKSFLAAIMLFLIALLYPNQKIYIISSTGDQAKNTFTKIEEMVTRVGRTVASIDYGGMPNPLQYETVKSPMNKTGFNHSVSGYHVEFYNGSEIYTLNSIPSHARSRRASVVFFDEAAFCSEELIAACEPFTSQDASFKTSVNDDFNVELIPLARPNKRIYASSQDTIDTKFYATYKDFAKRMLAGDREYFACDMVADTALQTYMNGKSFRPLVNQSDIDTMMSVNRQKALREYFNEPTADGGDQQIVKWATIRKCEDNILPQIERKDDRKIVLAIDPARTADNSIIGAMAIYEHPERGWCGDIVNIISLIDIAHKKKFNLDSNRQLEIMRNNILAYNGKAKDYDNIDVIMLDSGSGGGGVSTYADQLLNSWQDKYGREHIGLIDRTSEIYSNYNQYKDNIDKIRLITPNKYRKQMFEEMIELIDLGVIRMPMEYSASNSIQFAKQDSNGQEKIFDYKLNDEEKLALANIDLMKVEVTSIHRYKNSDNTGMRYALPKDKENKLHDDRAFVLALLSHRLYELRRGTIIKDTKTEIDISNILKLSRQSSLLSGGRKGW